MRLDTLDLFSAAAGGWSLGMRRAGFKTMAACENVAWRRALYRVNNPGVRIYDEVRTLTADRLLADYGRLPKVIVGSPPCQDISAANSTGAGLEGERSSLYFEAPRLVGECRPRWFAFENSAMLRTRGADQLLGAFGALNYACEAIVVGGEVVGANHDRKRSWLIGFDPTQIVDAPGLGCERRRPWRYRAKRDGCASVEAGIPPYGDAPGDGRATGWPGGRADSAAGLSDGAYFPIAGGPDDGQDAVEPWPEWNGGLAHHLRLDDGLSAWLARTRIEDGAAKGTLASNLLTEAFGDAVLPQIPEAIGRAILRVESAMADLVGL